MGWFLLREHLAHQKALIFLAVQSLW
jgi:hypothetical protein